MKRLLFFLSCLVCVQSFGQSSAISELSVRDHQYIPRYADTPATGKRGDIIWKYTTNQLYVRNGASTAWVLINGSGGGVYTPAYGMALAGSAFRVDSSVITSQARTAAGLSLKQNTLAASSNGTIIVGNELKLGGSFTENTAIDGDETYGLSFTKLASLIIGLPSAANNTVLAGGAGGAASWGKVNVSMLHEAVLDSILSKKNSDDSTTANPSNYVTQHQRKKTSDSLQANISLKANTSSLATVATTGGYNDLTGKPTIPAQFNPIAGINVGLSGSYPNITFNATGDSVTYQTKFRSDSARNNLYPAIAAKWGITGNAGTTAGTHFIGTTDNVDVVFKRNGVESGRIGESNTSLGEGALAVNAGDDNVGIGDGALGSNVGGYSNTAIGKNASASIVGGASNTAIGEAAGFLNISGLSNVAIGSGGLYNATGSFSTALGSSSLYQTTTGTNNIGLGYSAGKYNSTLSNRLFINSLDRSNLAGDSTLSILYGFQAATIADQKLRVNGKFQIDDGTQGVGKVLVSDANGVGSWQTPSGGSGTEVYNEPSTGFTGTSMSTTNTPTTGTLRLFKNGIRLVLGYDYTITGSTVTLAVAAISSDYFIKDYKY